MGGQGGKISGKKIFFGVPWTSFKMFAVPTVWCDIAEFLSELRANTSSPCGEQTNNF